MTIQLISAEEADLAGAVPRQVLLEQNPGFYKEFKDFLMNRMDGEGGSLFFLGPSRQLYRVGPAEEGASGLPGIEICLMESQPNAPEVSDETIDLDLWSFLEWLVEKVGGEWTSEALEKTGAIYRAPGASERD
jgi:hypothetical protein